VVVDVSWPAAEAWLQGPLAGVRVLDLSRILAGPYAATLLGDLGADVIKVERPDVGDETRRWGPPFHGDTAAYFYTANRHRRSLTLDLKHPDHQRVARELAADADVLIENFLPGTMERLGLAPADLQEANPKLVLCTISGYGDGSRRQWPALDFVIQAHAGLMGVTGPDGHDPVKAGAPVADMATGLFAAVGLLAALVDARSTGVGAHVEVPLTDASTCLLANQAMNWLIGGIDARPAGNAHPSIAPYQTIAAQDRPIALAATSDAQFQRLCNTVGRPDLREDARFATNASRVAHRAELAAELDAALGAETAATWVQRLNEAGVAAAVINSVAEILEDSDTAARLVTSVGEGDDRVPQLRSPIRINGAALDVRSAPPPLGAHTDEILEALAHQEAVPDS
jgi:crotonobetainyl-CoA:carnitine CoA-transferase CaiB-like acyl-CoA transferase